MHWKEALAGNKQSSKISHLEYIALREDRAFVSEATLQRAVEKWGRAKPYYIHLCAYIRCVWKLIGEFSLYSRKDYFLVMFEGVDDCDRVLKGGPFLFDSRLIIIQKWKPEIRFSDELLSTLPICVWFDLFFGIMVSLVLFECFGYSDRDG